MKIENRRERKKKEERRGEEKYIYKKRERVDAEDIRRN